MSDPSGISRDEWLKAAGGIEKFEDDPSALTIQEFSEMLNIHRSAGERRLRAMERTGKVIRTHKWANGTDGRRCWFVAYKLVEPQP